MYANWHVFDVTLNDAQLYIGVTLCLASALITVFSIYKIIEIITILGDTFNKPKLILHALLLVIQTTTACLFIFSWSQKCYLVCVFLEILGQLFISYICLTMGSQKALKDFECTI
jgi:hypothetical protein